MSAVYQAISFNRQKKIYDKVIFWGLMGYFLLFFVLNIIFYPQAVFETILLRATGSAAFLLLHVILCIGPLCRFSPFFTPLLYNRRHLGLSMFFIALIHGSLALLHFHGLGDTNPLLSLFLSNTDYLSLREFPFQSLGFFALLIFFLMAASSHDFWLANLGPHFWKGLHMLVYVAYGLALMHVALGSLQAEYNPVLSLSIAFAFCLLFTLHLGSAWKEYRKDKLRPAAWEEDYAYVCLVDEIQENCAKIINLGGERVAVFRYKNQVSALSNVCRHQNGPLGEGRIIDGCVTCPWHGFQYRPEDGASPPPFHEKVPTYQVKLKGKKVYVHPKALAAGTYVKPAAIV